MTEDVTWQDGSIWFSQIQNDVNFEIELEFYTGNKDGADGLVVAFFADKTRKVEQGEGLGFDGCNGYGVELDTYRNSNRGDPSYNHIALLDGTVSNHKVYADASGYTEDGKWHKLKIVNKNGTCTAYIDDKQAFTYDGIAPKSTFDIGITAATGSSRNRHAVRNIKLTESGLRTYTDKNGSILYGMYTGAVIGYTGNPTSLYIPGTVNGTQLTSISPKAFASCSTLKNIYLPASINTIAEDALPAGVTVWGSYPEPGPSFLDTSRNPYRSFVEGISGAYKPFSLDPAILPDASHMSVIGGNAVTITLETLTPVIVPLELYVGSGQGEAAPSISYQKNDRGGMTYTLKTSLSKVTGVETAEYAGQTKKVDFELYAADNTCYNFSCYLDKTPPPAITNLSGEYTGGNAVLNWTSPQADGTAATYNIYEAASATGPWTKIASGASPADNKEMTWSMRRSPTAADSFYYVTTVDVFGQESSPSTIFGIGLVDTTAPTDIILTKPASNSIISTKEEFSASATDDAGLASYTINVRTSQDKNSPVIHTEMWTATVSGAATPHTVNFSDLPSGPIFVEIIATDLFGNSSSGQFIYAYTLDNDPPPKVTGLSATASTSFITLKWNDFDNADKQDFKCFEVQWAEGGAGDGDAAFTHSLSNITTLGANITSVNPDTTYTFRVRAIDVRGNEGEWSETLTVATISDTQAPVVAVMQPPMGRYKDPIHLSYSLDDDYGISNVIIMVSQDVENNVWTEASVINVNTVGTHVSANYTLDLAEYSEGLLRVRPVAVDFAGNESDQGASAPFVDYIVDRTAPAAPLVTSAIGNDTSILVNWEKGTEEDLGTYSVYRASSESGAYTQIASNLKSIDYLDSSITPGTTYYYKIRVNDQAGNVSDYSNIVASSTSEDRDSPEILSVSPSDGYTLGPIHSIKVSLTDNVALRQLIYRYSTAGYGDLDQTGTVSVSGRRFVTAVPIDIEALAQSENATDIYMEMECIDASGNRSQSVRRHYRLDFTPPATPDLSVTPGNFRFDLTWSAPDSDAGSLAGFKIYRAVSAASNFTMIGQRSRTNLSYCDTGLTAGANYYYYIEAMDENGNVSRSNTVGPVQVDSTDTTPPVAKISAPDSAMALTEINFSGTGSTDNVGVESYTWDFGDGTALQSGAQLTHRYATSGTYHVTLRVADAYGNSNTATHSITVKEFTQTGTVRVIAKDENGTPIPGAGIYFDLGSETQQSVTADSSGTATFTVPVGPHTVGGYREGYLPDKKDVSVTSGQATELILFMEKKNIVAGSLEVKEMTLEEIIAAGIDIRNPANQQIYEFTIQLTYGSYSDKFKVVTNSAGAILSDPKKATISDSSGPRDIVIAAAPSPTVVWNGTEVKVPTVVILDLPGKVTLLKDFFDVRLTVINQARDEFFLDDCSATLNVPSGLTLLDTNRTTSSPVVSMGTIQGAHQKSVEWILRGDRAGKYDLTADFTSILREFGIAIDAKFEANRPIEVRDPGASGDLVLEVIAENMIVGDTDGALRVGIRNDGTKTFNMVNLDLSDLATLKKTTKMCGFRKAPDSNMNVLNPGETLYWDYIVPRANWETLTTYHGENFYLMDAAVRGLGGNASLKAEIKEVMPFTLSADKIVITRGAAGSQVPLTYVNLNKDNPTAAAIPDLTITTYRLDEDGNYQPAPLQVTIEDEYLRDKNSLEGKRTITTGEDGKYTLPGYPIDVKFFDDLTSYNIRFTSSRAKPIDLPVNIYGKYGETGILNARVVEQVTDSSGKLCYQTLDGVAISVPDANLSGSTARGKVKLDPIKTGEHLVLLEKAGYLPIRKTVKFSKDENELVFTMRKDTDPSSSVITDVSTSLNEYTYGNHVVFPKGQLDDEVVTFELSKRISDGDVFSHYIFRVRRGDNVVDTVEITGDIGFWYDYGSLEPGDITEFAMVYQRAGETITTPWVDSNITIAPPLTALGQLRVAMADVFTFIGKPAFEADYEWKEKPLKYDDFGKPTQTKPDNKKYYTGLFEPFNVDDPEGKEVFTQMDKLYMTESSKSWTVPFDVKYELSGKFTFTVSAKHGNKTDITRIKDAAYVGAPQMFEWKATNTFKWNANTSAKLELKIIARFDKVENDWKWSVESTLGGSQSMEFPIIDTGLATGLGFYLTVKISATETATWVLLEEAGFSQKAGWILLPDGIAPKTLSAGAEFKGAIGLDVVTKGLFSAGLWIKAGATLEFARSRMKVSAAFGHEETLLFFLKNEGDILTKDWYIDSSENISNVSELMFSPYALQMQVMPELESDSYSVDLGQSEMRQVYSRRGGKTPLVSDVFLETEPLLVELDNGSTLMVYCGKSGNTSQPSVLYYSVYTPGGGWSDPMVIDGDGTPDIYPNITKTAQGAMLIWNDFARPLTSSEINSGTSAAAAANLAPQTNIAIMEYDSRTGAWSAKSDIAPGSIHGTNAVNVKPAGVQMADGSWLLAWISSDSLLTTGVQNDLIAYALVSGDGSVTTSGTIPSPKAYISGVGLSVLADKAVLSAICSDDNDFASSSLYMAPFVGSSFVSFEKVNPFPASDTCMVTAQDSIFYLNSGRIYRYDGHESVLLYTAPEEVEAMDHLSYTGSGALSWITRQSGVTTVYVSKLQSDGTMTMPAAVLTETDGTITSAHYTKLGVDATILYRYNEILDEEGWTHNIISYQVQDGIDLSVAAADVSSTGYILPGAAISYFVKAQDLGTVGTSEMRVDISTSRDGSSPIASTTVSANEAGIEVSIPSNYAGEPYYLVVTPMNGHDIDLSNNSVLLENTFTDLSLPRATYVGPVDGCNDFVVSIRNEGRTESEPIQILASDVDVDIDHALMVVPVRALMPGEFIDVLVEVDSNLIPVGHTARFALFGQGEDLNGVNDTAFAYIEYPENGHDEPSPNFFTVTLTPGAGSGEPVTESLEEGTKYIIPGGGIFSAPEGMEFLHWKALGDVETIYAPGDVIFVENNLTLEAVWKKTIAPTPVCEHLSTSQVSTVVEEPTCSDTGIERIDTVCDNCGIVLDTRSTAIAPTQAHQFGEWITVLEPTDVDAGKKERICGTCGLIEASVILPTGTPEPTVYTISYDSDGRAGTMAAEAAYEGIPHSLPQCQFIPNRAELFSGWLIDGNIHQPGDEVSFDADTTVTAVWTECGHDTLKQIPAVSATCQSTGLSEGKICADCGEITQQQEILDRVPHSYGEWEVTLEPTTTTMGEKMRTCELCGDVQRDVIDKLTDPTPGITYYPVTFDGNGGYGSMAPLSIKDGEELILPTPAFTAPDGKEFSAWTVDGVSHAPGDSIVVRKPVVVYALWKQIGATDDCEHPSTTTLTGYPATCTAEGLSDGLQCSICGEVLLPQEVLPKAAHEIGVDKVVTKEPTCTSAGVESLTTYCLVCDEELGTSQNSIPALGHLWADWEIIAEPTATAPGVESCHCRRCSTTETREIPKLFGYFGVSLDVQGGYLPFGVGDYLITDGTGKLTSLPTPTRDGYHFAGWYMSVDDSSVPVTTSTVFYADSTLYAAWTPAYVPPPDTTPWIPPVAPPSDNKDNSSTTTDKDKDNNGNKDDGLTPIPDDSIPTWPSHMEFLDVDSQSWYHDPISFVYEKGIMKGVGERLFAPNEYLTRAMMAQILFNYEAPEKHGYGPIPFTDVNADAWFADAVKWAYDEKIIAGYDSKLFGPFDSITREQAAVILWRHAGCPLSNASLHFADTSEISPYAQTAISWCVSERILMGYEDNSLNPKGKVTRAEAAAMLMRYLEPR